MTGDTAGDALERSDDADNATSSAGLYGAPSY